MKGVLTVKRTISNGALKLLNGLLTPIAVTLIVTVFSYSSLGTYEAAKSYSLFGDAMESIGMSLAIAVGGSLLFDIENKQRGHKSSDNS